MTLGMMRVKNEDEIAQWLSYLKVAGSMFYLYIKDNLLNSLNTEHGENNEKGWAQK